MMAMSDLIASGLMSNGLPVESVESFLTSLVCTIERLHFGVYSNMYFEAVGGEESLATTWL